MGDAMLARLRDKLITWERGLRTSFGDDISTPEARRAALRHYRWIDHGILRVWWKNFHQVDEGVFRANQPSPARLAQFREMGIRTVVNLRGPSAFSPYLFEREACRELGLTLVNRHINASSASSRAQFLDLVDAFAGLERPFVMHCKSGADRAGMASALWLIHMRGASVAEARRQLDWRRLHVTFTAHGILDFILDRYETAQARTGIGLRDWLAHHYDAAEMQAAFDATPRPLLGRRRG
ncbi:MAG: tyrosine-protein phosphatase [Rhodobacteraceae bacterium]|nr:tyrosine-protein phosphatase [Paracoccaceae bacterium]